MESATQGERVAFGLTVEARLYRVIDATLVERRRNTVQSEFRDRGEWLAFEARALHAALGRQLGTLAQQLADEWLRPKSGG